MLKNLLGSVSVSSAAFADEEVAMLSLDVLPRQRKGNLDDVGLLDRSSDVMCAERWGAPAGGSFEPELQESAAQRGAGCDSCPDSDDVVTRRKVGGKRNALDGEEARAAVAGRDGQIRSAIEMGQLFVVLVIPNEGRPIAEEVHARWVHFGGLVESKCHRARRAGNLLPVITQRIVGRRDFSQFRD